MNELLLQIACRFDTNGEPLTVSSHAGGFINHTYLVETNKGVKYLLQQVSHTVFPNIPALMNNLTAVTAHIRAKESDPRKVLTVVATKDGENFCQDDAGNYWRMLVFIENSICLPFPETRTDFYESAVTIGRFAQQLDDFQTEQLT